MRKPRVHRSRLLARIHRWMDRRNTRSTVEVTREQWMLYLNNCQYREAHWHKTLEVGN